jgi:hypothetical protein
MFLVGGGILTHGVSALHHGIEVLAHGVEALPGLGALFAALTPMVLNAAAGIAAGAIVYFAVALVRRTRSAATQSP